MFPGETIITGAHEVCPECGEILKRPARGRLEALCKYCLATTILERSEDKLFDDPSTMSAEDIEFYDSM